MWWRYSLHLSNKTSVKRDRLTKGPFTSPGMLGHGELGGAFRGGLYPSPEPLGLGGSEQHMMR